MAIVGLNTPSQHAHDIILPPPLPQTLPNRRHSGPLPFGATPPPERLALFARQSCAPHRIQGCIGVFYKRGAVVSAGVVSYMTTAALGGDARDWQMLSSSLTAWNWIVDPAMWRVCYAVVVVTSSSGKEFMYRAQELQHMCCIGRVGLTAHSKT